MKLKGLNKVLENLEAKKGKAKHSVAEQVKRSANEMSSDAKRNAPKIYKYAHGGTQPTNGEINQSISAVQNGQMNWSVSVNSKMGAYAEFGTGAFVEVPEGWNDIAWSYYVNGKGLMLPQPYFYPAYRKMRKQFIIDLRKTLDRL